MTNAYRTDRPIRRAPRLAAAALLCLGTVALAPAAHAEPGEGQGQGQGHGQGHGQGQGPALAPGQGEVQPGTSTPAQAAAPQGQGSGHANGHAGNQGHGSRGHGSQGHGQGNGQGNGAGHGHGNGNGNQGGNPGQGNPGQGNPGQGNPGQGNPGQGGGSSATHDPAGNNGTVKIAPLGDVDGIPDNTPHVGCTFLVEWYGFDRGADIISTVSFEAQAPTSDVVITGTEPSQVFVGEDSASGAGTDTGLDARQPYTLSFAGEPHPKQGYHVRLTIHTPGSIGNDSKSKVFWVEGCLTTTPETSTAPEVPAVPQTPTTQEGPEVLPETAAPEQAPEVLGEQAFADVSVQLQPQAQSLPDLQAQPQSQQELPMSVNAGAAGSQDRGPVSGTTSLLGLLLVLLGALSARLGWVRARG